MSDSLGRLIAAQRGLIAVWQMRQVRVERAQIDVVVRRLRRVHRGVYATGDLDELGWLLAAALALGPGSAVSRLSALMLYGLRPSVPCDIDVTVPRGGGRSVRDGIVVHRSRDLLTTRWRGIPVTTPTQALRDAPLQRHELYRALEQADLLGLAVDRTQLPRDVANLQKRVRGRTRSDTEAAFRPSLPRPRAEGAACQPSPQPLRDRLPLASRRSRRRGRRLRASSRTAAVQRGSPTRSAPSGGRLRGRARQRRSRPRPAGPRRPRAARRRSFAAPRREKSSQARREAVRSRSARSERVEWDEFSRLGGRPEIHLVAGEDNAHRGDVDPPRAVGDHAGDEGAVAEPLGERHDPRA